MPNTRPPVVDIKRAIATFALLALGCGDSGTDVCNSIVSLKVTDPAIVARCPSDHPVVMFGLSKEQCVQNATKSLCAAEYQQYLVCFRSSPSCYTTSGGTPSPASSCTAQETAFTDCVHKKYNW